uniref:Putative 17.2 kDa salivary protein n=2 Tax=Culex tarsalis TaxID=7177 RepID=A0A1Q3EUW3_CULTA
MTSSSVVAKSIKMKEFLAVGLGLVLASVALANPWGGPGVCVRFHNMWSGEQLTTSWQTHDRDRRHVSTSSGEGDNWVITKDERYPDHYKIKHKGNGEELFESVQNYKGNYIFTWIPKTLINDGGASWNIMWVHDNVHKLKNKKLGHCLWNVDGKIGAYPNCDNKQYEWKILKVVC